MLLEGLSHCIWKKGEAVLLACLGRAKLSSQGTLASDPSDVGTLGTRTVVALAYSRSYRLQESARFGYLVKHACHIGRRQLELLRIDRIATARINSGLLPVHDSALGRVGLSVRLRDSGPDG